MSHKLTKKEEADWLLLLHSGNAQAFALLYDQYASLVMGLVLKMCGNDKEEANRIFISAMVELRNYFRNHDAKPGESLPGLVIRIVRNHALLQEPVKNAPLNPSVSFPGWRKDQDLLLKYIFLKGFNAEEAASKANIPSGTVKTRLRNMLAEFRKPKQPTLFPI